MYLNNSCNVHYGFPLTHNPYKLGLLPHEFTKFTNYDFNNNDIHQYILNNLYVYDMNLIKFQDYTDVYNNYIKINEKMCISQFQNVVKK